MDRARGSLGGKDVAADGGRAADDDLWTRIVALAKKEKLSYLKATERCLEEYWNDHGLDKNP